MKKQIKNIALWFIPVFTTFCSVVYINLAVQKNESNNLASSIQIVEQIESPTAKLNDKKSVTHFE